MRSCNQCYKFETHTDMVVASAADLATASAQGTILLIKYGGAWYGKGEVGSSNTKRNSWSDQGAASNSNTDYRAASNINTDYMKAKYFSKYQRNSSYGTTDSSSNQSESSYGYGVYAAVGGAVLVLLGVAVGGFRKATRRRVLLAADEGTSPSTTSPPLV